MKAGMSPDLLAAAAVVALCAALIELFPEPPAGARRLIERARGRLCRRKQG